MSNSTQNLIYENEELKAMLRESEQFAAQLEIQRDRLQDKVASLEEALDEITRIGQEGGDHGVRETSPPL